MERKGLKSQVHNDRKKRKARTKPRGRKKPGRMAIYGNAYNQLRSDVGYLMSMINTETKYVDSTNIQTMSGAWQQTLLNGLVQGTTSTTRLGQSLKATGIEFKCFVTMNAAATAISSYRVMIFMDKQPNATAPTTTDVYPAAAVSYRTVAYLDRFSIIWEKWAILDVEFPTGEIESFSKTLNFHEEFNTSNAGTIADITKNSLYIAFYSDAGSNFPSINWSVRYVFVDN